MRHKICNQSENDYIPHKGAWKSLVCPYYNFLIYFAFLIDIIDNIITYSSYSPYYVTRTSTNGNAMVTWFQVSLLSWESHDWFTTVTFLHLCLSSTQETFIENNSFKIKNWNICLMYNYRVYNNRFWMFYIQIEYLSAKHV